METTSGHICVGFLGLGTQAEKKGVSEQMNSRASHLSPGCGHRGSASVPHAPEAVISVMVDSTEPYWSDIYVCMSWKPCEKPTHLWLT